MGNFIRNPILNIQANQESNTLVVCKNHRIFSLHRIFCLNKTTRWRFEHPAFGSERLTDSLSYCGQNNWANVFFNLK